MVGDGKQSPTNFGDVEDILIATFSIVTSLSAIGPLLVAAYRDVTKFTIPNILCAVIAALGILRIVSAGDMNALLYTIAVGTIAFIIGLLLFSRGHVGGGDVKLVTATILLIGYQDTFRFLIWTSVAGAFLSLVVLIRFRILSNQPELMLVPYGAAIAAAAIAMLLIQSSQLV